MRGIEVKHVGRKDYDAQKRVIHAESGRKCDADHQSTLRLLRSPFIGAAAGARPNRRSRRDSPLAAAPLTLQYKVLCVHSSDMRILRAAHLGMCFGVRDAIAL